MSTLLKSCETPLASRPLTDEEHAHPCPGRLDS